jgi:hypothetical protein
MKRPCAPCGIPVRVMRVDTMMDGYVVGRRLGVVFTVTSNNAAATVGPQTFRDNRALKSNVMGDVPLLAKDTGLIEKPSSLPHCIEVWSTIMLWPPLMLMTSGPPGVLLFDLKRIYRMTMLLPFPERSTPSTIVPRSWMPSPVAVWPAIYTQLLLMRPAFPFMVPPGEH